MSSDQVKWQLLQREGTCSYPLPQYGLIFIGCEECDIILQSPGVEKRHAVLSFNADKQDFYIKDLNSMTGTYINDKRIPEQSYFKLNHNDEIRFGYGAYFTLNKKYPEVTDVEEQKGVGSSSAAEPQDILEADSLEDLKDVTGGQQKQPTSEAQSKGTTSAHDKREDLTLSLGKPGHKITPLSSQVIINYSTTAMSPDRKSDDLSSRTNGSVESSDSSAGTMTLTAVQQQQPHNTQQQLQQQQQPAAMAFTIPFDGQVSSKTFTRKKPKLKEERTKGHGSSSDVERGSKLLRTLNKSSSDDHSSENEQYLKSNGVDKKAPDKAPSEALPESTGQAPLSDTTSYLIQRMLDGSSPQPSKWASKKSPETTPVPSRWAVKKTSEPDLSSQILSPSHSKWSSKTPDSDLPPLCSPSQAKWAARNTFDSSSPPPGKWAARRTPEQEVSSPSRWSARKTPEQEPPPPSKWAILSATCDSALPSEPTPPREKDSDDKSETGTYTVDTELEDPVVEEARSKIDEVFGVADKKSGSRLTPNEKSSPANQSDLRHTANEFKQSKHPITTPPAEKNTFDFIPFNHVMTNSTPNLYSNTYRTRKEAFQFENHAQTPPPPRPPPRSSRSSVPKPDSRPRENGGQVMGRSLSNNETGDSLSDGSPQATKHAFYGVSPWRRKSWNISCSDLELDHGKAETSSVLSDLSTSTEPSSHSSHSSRSRSGDVGPQMRLNRAFALRRARLGFESDEAVRAPPQGVQAVRPLPRGASVSQNNLSRQDGGRFSLRLPRSAVVKVNKQPVKPRENRNVVQPFQHQQPDTRSYVPVPVRKELVAAPPELEPLQINIQGRSKKEVSALDSLVISAIQQLSVKLKANACQLLERERQKYPESSDTRLMIEEILPQMMDKRSADVTSEGNLTKDLSSILKNLKRVEQTLDVFAVLSEQHPPPTVLPASSANSSGDQMKAKPAGKRGFFVVDV